MTDDRYDLGYAVGLMDGQKQGYGEGAAEASDRVRSTMLNAISNILNAPNDPVTKVDLLGKWVTRERVAHTTYVEEVLEGFK